MAKLEVDIDNETIKRHKVITIKTEVMITFEGRKRFKLKAHIRGLLE